jgi:hypothetical protein
MKKAILLLAMITLTATRSQGQSVTTTTITDNREKLLFGLKIGTNYSNIYDSQGENFVADSKFG